MLCVPWTEMHEFSSCVKTSNSLSQGLLNLERSSDGYAKNRSEVVINAAEYWNRYADPLRTLDTACEDRSRTANNKQWNRLIMPT
jgi:hypothetical protein